MRPDNAAMQCDPQFLLQAVTMIGELRRGRRQHGLSELGCYLKPRMHCLSVNGQLRDRGYEVETGIRGGGGVFEVLDGAHQGADCTVTGARTLEIRVWLRFGNKRIDDVGRVLCTRAGEGVRAGEARLTLRDPEVGGGDIHQALLAGGVVPRGQRVADVRMRDKRLLCGAAAHSQNRQDGQNTHTAQNYTCHCMPPSDSSLSTLRAANGSSARLFSEDSSFSRLSGNRSAAAGYVRSGYNQIRPELGMGQATLTATPTTTDDASADDSKLLKQVAAGNKAAFEAFYRRYYRRVSQFVYRLTPDRQLGEEIVDDTMLAVWRSAGKFAGRSKVSTWVLGIAYRRAMKTLDREMKHRNADHDETILEMQPDADAARDPLAMAAASTIQRQLGVFVDKLHINQRVALQLTALGHSYPEISVIVGCPANTVKTRVFKARHKLKGYLSDAGIRL